MKSKAVALTCADWTRVFASWHATIQPAPGRAIKTFGIVLDGEQQAVTDRIESEGVYYDKIEVPVMLHRPGQPDEPGTAKVYQ